MTIRIEDSTTGPYGGWPGVDQIAQGMSGLMSLTGHRQTGPTRVGIPIGDVVAGMWAALGIQAAVIQRQATGRGQLVETSLLAGLIALLTVQGQRQLSLGDSPGVAGNEHPVIYPYGTFQAKDGPFNMAVATEHMWVKLCRLLDMEECIDDPDFKDNNARSRNRDELRPRLNERFAARGKMEWTLELVKLGLPAGPIFSLDQVFADPHVEATRMVDEVEHPRLGRLRVIASPIRMESLTGRSVRRAPRGARRRFAGRAARLRPGGGGGGDADRLPHRAGRRGERVMLSDQLAYVALVSSDVAATSSVFRRHLRLPCVGVGAPQGEIPVFAIGRSALAVFPPGHRLVDGDTTPGVHHLALGVDDLARASAAAAAAGIPAQTEAPAEGLAGRRCVKLARSATAGVRVVLTERLEPGPHAGGAVERIDHVGVASDDVFEDERVFAGKLGFPVESRQTDMEVALAVESFTSDRYGVVYHARPPEPVGGLRVIFITVGDCELEFLADFDPALAGHVQQGRAGSTRQDQGAIARFVRSRGRGLHHIAVKTRDIDGMLASMAEAGLPMIDVTGRPGSRRARIGFPHPRGLGGVLMHFVQRDA